mmetsp:Transcript_63747/g.190185  ORF Transcript_63747/g.190185 Transcript_63747/m.190185 type:complete len:206 (+) Transcript_63747:638-1255(+)
MCVPRPPASPEVALVGGGCRVWVSSAATATPHCAASPRASCSSTGLSCSRAVCCHCTTRMCAFARSDSGLFARSINVLTISDLPLNCSSSHGPVPGVAGATSEAPVSRTLAILPRALAKLMVPCLLPCLPLAPKGMRMETGPCLLPLKLPELDESPSRFDDPPNGKTRVCWAVSMLLMEPSLFERTISPLNEPLLELGSSPFSEP